MLSDNKTPRSIFVSEVAASIRKVIETSLCRDIQEGELVGECLRRYIYSSDSVEEQFRWEAVSNIYTFVSEKDVAILPAEELGRFVSVVMQVERLMPKH